MKPKPKGCQHINHDNKGKKKRNKLPTKIGCVKIGGTVKTNLQVKFYKTVNLDVAGENIVKAILKVRELPITFLLKLKIVKLKRL
ncbi:MAG: hypothetical protein N3E48_04875 [Candidatus Bathyarchaeota archaeon]|nr:hypothetical protein [Candidatus Bathyarchaeota archaeon]